MSPCRAHIAHSLTDNYFVVSSTVSNVGLCNPAHLIGLWLECMACTLGDCSTTSSIKLLNTTLLYWLLSNLQQSIICILYIHYTDGCTC